MTTEIEKLGQLQMLNVRPGDRFVLTSARPLTPEQMKSIRGTWERYFASGAVPELLILDGGLEIGVIRAESAAQCPA